MCSRSFGSQITEYTDMRQAVCAFAERAAEKLRKEKAVLQTDSCIYPYQSARGGRSVSRQSGQRKTAHAF
ncbi:hypothetical protein [Pantoea ananatis]|uniref:DinB/UmuC family translesion DNA polymerase n=1 Tax=Pantoea ananas TaxID=553 RepID=UPI003BB0A54C